MDDASGVKAVQRDQGEARRSGVISRSLRRLCIWFLATKNLQRCHLHSLCSDYTW